MILSRNDGVTARTPQEAQQVEAAGYKHCYGKLHTPRGMQSCTFYISPEAVSVVQQRGGGYYTCPVCRMSFDLMEDVPWHGATEGEFTAGGGTRIGLSLADQGQIGEDLVEKMANIPGYGPITWWHHGGASVNSPLDGATAEWGIEVKTLGYDAMHHRFIPGRVKEKMDKNNQAEKMGLKGVLAILVLLDYRRSVADVYAREYPLERGVGAYRSHQGQHMVAELPFNNPFMQPEHPAPHAPNHNASQSPFGEVDNAGEAMAF